MEAGFLFPLVFNPPSVFSVGSGAEAAGFSTGLPTAPIASGPDIPTLEERSMRSGAGGEGGGRRGRTTMHEEMGKILRFFLVEVTVEWERFHVFFHVFHVFWKGFVNVASSYIRADVNKS